MQKNQDSCFLYIATGSNEGIFLTTLEFSSAKFSTIHNVAKVSHAFVTLNLTGKYLYATQGETVSKNEIGAINSFAINDKTGGLNFLNSKRINHLSFLYVDVAPQGDLVLVASYSGGAAAAFPLLEGGSLAEVSSLFLFNHEGSKANKNRQFKPFPHSITFDVAGSHAFLCDLGADKVFIYKREGNCLKPSKQAFLKLTAGSGPRHIAKHPNGKIIYILNELNASVAVCSWHNETLSLQQIIRTLPESVTEKNTAAEICITKDAKFLYCSNRAHGNNHDCIASYRVLGQGILELLEFTPTDRHPRHFCLDPTEQFLLVANRDSDNVVLYQRNTKTGRLVRSEQELSVPRPICIRTLRRVLDA